MPLDVSEFNGILVLKKVPKISTFCLFKNSRNCWKIAKLTKAPATENFRVLQFCLFWAKVGRLRVNLVPNSSLGQCLTIFEQNKLSKQFMKAIYETLKKTPATEKNPKLGLLW